jgi:hypothetical protein
MGAAPRRCRRVENKGKCRKDSLMTPVEVRRGLVDALKLDLVGPDNGSVLEAEVLPQAPSRWYLTGFLVPLEAGEVQRSDETANDDLDSPAAGGDASDDDTTPEPPAARRAFFSLVDWPEPARLQADPSAPARSELGRLPCRASGRPGGRRRESCPRDKWANAAALAARAPSGGDDPESCHRNRQGRRARGPGQRRSARGGLGAPRASPGDR